MSSPNKVVAYLRQPTSLFALGLLLGTLVATWFHVISTDASAALLITAIPMLASDNSGLLSSLTAQRDDLAAAMQAVASHKDIGPAAIKVIADTLPAGSLFSATASALINTERPAAPASSTGKSGASVAAIMLLGVMGLGLTACGTTPQAKMRQTVFDVASAYHVASSPMPDVMAGKVPGITLTDEQKTLVRKSSQTVVNELTTLELDIHNNSSLTQTSISGLQAALLSFQTCWAGVKAGTIPDACRTEESK
ncbi:hypothetical protein [Acetobacter papayae]|uniref:hypothetical protein n=1 Tax=Acetobacter papayae TaxID=1076592 RepID=UPI0039E81CAF